MKHHALEQLQSVAEDQDYPRQTMSRGERLDRWAELLEQNPGRHLATLHQTEHQPNGVRAAMRSDGSPISVAFEDPVLRAAGLENDRYGEAKRLSHWRPVISGVTVATNCWHRMVHRRQFAHGGGCHPREITGL